MRPTVLLIGLASFLGCSFEPDLEGRGYVRCEVQADCDSVCTCGRDGYCLPPDGLQPDSCLPGLPSVEAPGRLLRIDWSNPDTTRTLDVDAPGDGPFEPAEQDFEVAYQQALADDGALSLREALIVASLADKPVRIRFARGLFPPDGSGPPIELTDAITLSGENILLDGRDTGEVITFAGDPRLAPLNLLTVSGRVLTLAGLRFDGYDERAIRVYDAEGVYLTGLILEGNRIGLWVQRSDHVILSDAAEYLGEAEAVSNSMRFNNTGLVILQSSQVRVYGTELVSNWEEGLRLGQACLDVGLGPTVFEDGRAWTRVLIAENLTGINVFGFDGQASVRGAELVANEVDVSIQASQGVLAFVNVTVANSEYSVIEHHDDPGGLLLVLRNLIVHGWNPDVNHLHCYGVGDTLTIDADKLLFSSWVNLDCAQFGDGFGPGATVWEDVDPGFVDSENGDFRLAAGSPAIDVGVELDHEGLPLDFNGPDEGLFCGAAPDLGAHEYCP